jgi:hypothetical protein
MTTEQPGASPAFSDQLGLMPAGRCERGVNANIAIWGCIVCSSIWSASNSGPVKFLMSTIWLVFAGLILWIERDARKA